MTLRVLTRAGGVCHLYPVNEFVPDSAPTSDADGRMVFHHRARGLEFGGRDHLSLLGVRLTKEGAPQYVLAFDAGGREVYRARYSDLRPRGEDGPRVSVPWRPPDWPAKEFLSHPDEELTVLKRRLYDGDGDGVLDREERTAAGYFERAVDDALEPNRGPREVTFEVVELTVTISLPK